MPIEEYSPLKGLLLDSKMDGVRALADVCHSSGRNTLGKSSTNAFKTLLVCLHIFLDK